MSTGLWSSILPTCWGPVFMKIPVSLALQDQPTSHNPSTEHHKDPEVVHKSGLYAVCLSGKQEVTKSRKLWIWDGKWQHIVEIRLSWLSREERNTKSESRILPTASERGHSWIVTIWSLPVHCGKCRGEKWQNAFLSKRGWCSEPWWPYQDQKEEVLK